MDEDRAASDPDDGGIRTHFASPQRSAGEQLHDEVSRIERSPIVDALLTAADGMLAVLNAHRQVVALNPQLLSTLGVEEPWDVLGLRPGEAVGCDHARDNPVGGCGTGRMCASCGAAVAIVSALDSDEPAERLCCIQTEDPGADGDLYLSVRAHPIDWEDQRWVLLFLRDVSDQQKLTLLQRVFFHDIGNTITALVGTSFRLANQAPADLEDSAKAMERYANRLVHEVALQRLVLKAETDEVELNTEPVGLDEILDQLSELCSHHPSARQVNVSFDDRTGCRVIETDPIVLHRVLGNMLVNAMEATGPGGQVRVWCEEQAGRLVFCVANPGEMPVEVAGRVFQRNFSTKGTIGRGLGTWSMKMFGEKVLGGEVDFTSPGTGQTVFSFRLPVEPA